MEKTRFPAAVQERSLYQWTGRERSAEIKPKNGSKNVSLIDITTKK